jgi:N-acetylglucosaminyl-diphospho-decaprenol L-rhamnosyltransferase
MTDTAALASVTIVVVTYQSAHCLPRLGELLREAPHVVVVDNASTDGTAAAVAQHLPQAQLIRNTHNTGFGAANNAGLAEVQTPYALLLNPDCEVTTDAISALYAAQQRFPEAGMLAPQIIDGNGLPEINYRWPSTLWHSKGPGATGPCCVGFLCGAIIWLNLSKTRPLGHFDTHFFLYYEDDDLTLRTFNQTIPMLVIPSITARHRSRGSVKGKTPLKAEYLRGFHHARSKIQFTAKHVSPTAARHLQLKTWGLALVSLGLRLLWPSPRLIARNWGRIVALSRTV